jgi:hypothetical protein
LLRVDEGADEVFHAGLGATNRYRDREAG